MKREKKELDKIKQRKEQDEAKAKRRAREDAEE
jgi:hypothetical protein